MTRLPIAYDDLFQDSTPIPVPTFVIISSNTGSLRFVDVYEYSHNDMFLFLSNITKV